LIHYVHHAVEGIEDIEPYAHGNLGMHPVTEGGVYLEGADKAVRGYIAGEAGWLHLRPPIS